jgi:putative ABC transport system substrate-binding protein
MKRAVDAMMNRRTFLRTGACGLAGIPFASLAQTKKMPRVGALFSTKVYWEPSFWQGMRELGYIDGKTMVVERRSADGDFARLPALAAELVKLRPDVIVGMVTQASIAAKDATSTIPIVMVAVGDPVASGLVGNLARPGGNVTGTAASSHASVGKQVELVRELLPNAKHLAILWNPANVVFQQLLLSEALGACARLRMVARLVEVRNADELDRAFATFATERPDAVLTLLDPLFTTNAARIVGDALSHRLPTFGGSRPLVEAGYLASIGSNLAAIAKASAAYVDKILKGAKPGELPVEQPTRFEFVINLRTAKALGITIPQSVLLRADEVIQ